MHPEFGLTPTAQRSRLESDIRLVSFGNKKSAARAVCPWFVAASVFGQSPDAKDWIAALCIRMPWHKMNMVVSELLIKIMQKGLYSTQDIELHGHAWFEYE